MKKSGILPIWKSILITVLLALVQSDSRSAEEADFEIISWHKLPDLPNELGVAGPFTGVHNDVLIVAGGANFPDGVPWHPTSSGGQSIKKYHDSIYVLTRDNMGSPQRTPDGSDVQASEKYKWSTSAQKLSQPLGYGVSVPTSQGLVCIGGEWNEPQVDADGGTATVLKRATNVFRIGWDHKSQQVFVSKQWRIGTGDSAQDVVLPDLPIATTAACGAIIGETIYIAGGDRGDGGTRIVWKLNLNPSPDSDGPIVLDWEPVRSWNGEPRTHAIAVEQAGNLFLFSGRHKLKGQDFVTLNDAWRYDPDQDKWSRLADVTIDGQPRCVMAGTGAKLGSDYVFIFGGARGDVLKRHDNQLPVEIAAAEKSGNRELARQLTKQRNDLYDNHAGFSRDILAYNITIDRWAKKGQLPVGSPVTTNAVRWNDAIVIPTGEKSPGIRTGDVWLVTRRQPSATFGLFNWLVLIGYLSMLVAMGFYFSRRARGSQDFFLGSGRVPWWAAGLSIFATMLSAITYLSIPARTYGTNWSWLILNMGIPVVAIFVAFLYLPHFRRVTAASAYEYLETRFHVSLRLFGSLSFMLFQLGRMGIVVLLPALALSAVTGIHVYACIIAMGILSTLYTVLGGIEAVIWTDVVQVIVLIGGALAALFIMVSSYDGGLSSMLEVASTEAKFKLVNDWPVWNLAKDGILVILLGAIFTNLLPYTSDQAILQRYLTVSNESEARRAIWTNAIMTIPASILFFFVGTALWTFYRANPENMIPLEKPDQLFPWFIANEMPAGLAGLVIAGVFAAAMSSLDSSMHSIATAGTTDFYERFGRQKTSAESLRVARWLTIILGVAGTISALCMANIDLTYLWDQFLSIVGLFLGTVSGLFALGIFSKRTRTFHAWTGAVAGAGALAYFQFFSDLNINGLLNGVITWCTCVIVGMLASLILPTGASPKVNSS